MKIFVALFLCLALTVDAATYYVATNGSDGNPGTEGSPFLTVQWGIRQAVAGDTLKVGPGEYGEGPLSWNHGTPSSRITWDGQNVAKVRNLYLNHSNINVVNWSFNIDTNAAMVWFERKANNSVISNCVFDAFSNTWGTNLIRNVLGWQGPLGLATNMFGEDSIPTTVPASDNLIISNLFTRNLSGLQIGFYGDRNVAVGNRFIDLNRTDIFRPYGRSNIFIMNLVSNITETAEGLGHPDFIQLDGSAGSWGTIVESNIVIKMDNASQLGNLVTEFNPVVGNLMIRNNLFVGISAKCSILMPDVYFYNNLFVDCSTNTGNGGHVMNFGRQDVPANGSGDNCHVINNIFYRCGLATNTGWYGFSEDLTNVIADYNFVSKTNNVTTRIDSLQRRVGDPGGWWTTDWWEDHGINGGDPFLRYEQLLNFRPIFGSRLIGAGTNLSSIFSTDLDGHPRGTTFDIGPYQYVESPPPTLDCDTEPKTIRAYSVANTNWIGIVWPTNQYRLITMIARREYTNNPVHWAAWSNIYSNATDVTEEGSFIDTNVSSGIFYEYQISALSTNWVCDGVTNGPFWVFEYISTGTQVPLRDERGNVILLVESGVASSIASEIATLTNDFIGDGYKVFRHDVASVEVTNASWFTAVTNTRALVMTDYLTDTNSDWTLMILGHVPIPYGGLQSPGAHLDNFGAHPMDWYYADRSTNGWHDVGVNDSTADDPPQWNIPGDGKFDTNHIPNIPQLRLGRVDLNQFPSSGKTTAQLLSQYLNRNHQWRQKHFTVANKSTINFSNSLPAESHGILTSFYGTATNTVLTNWLIYVTNNSVLFAHSRGSGDYDYDASLNNPVGIGYTTNILKFPFQGVFMRLYGSYYGDWDSGMRSNLFLLAPLAANGYGLTAIYKENLLNMDPLSMGEPIGQEMFMMAANTFPDIDTRYRQPFNLTLFTERVKGYVSLQGDPTLRVKVVAPPTNVVYTPSGSDNEITWTDATDDYIQGYHVYRAPSTDLNDFTRLTSTPTVSPYTDAGAASGDYVYMVRTVKLEDSENRSFYNASQGSFAEEGEGEPGSSSGWQPFSGRVLIQGNVRIE